MLLYNNLHNFALNCRAQSKMPLLCVKSYSLNQFSAYLGLSKEATALSYCLWCDIGHTIGCLSL